MKKTLSTFLKFALAISASLFFVSFYYLLYSDGLNLDADSMLLAMLLVIFTAIISLVIIIVLSVMHKNKEV